MKLTGAYAFGENLVRFNEVADRTSDEDMRRFYHSLIVALAKQTKHGTFLQALHEAKEKIR
jgi:hypothetical protein